MLTLKDYEFSAKVQRLANRGAKKAQDKARKAGLAIPYSINGKLVYQLPDGSVVSKLKKQK